ncbi:PAS domain-containing protein [Sphingomonas bacterium]|uniref:PAS domain-containing protein n=1 Tax=Sphingomonas bacterium TaxID=1895847 RepID=UPI001575556A|nr:PAS domain-containing protein [Sphingomonas bacterium]
MTEREQAERSEQSRIDEQRIALEIAGLDRHTDPFVAAVHATRMPMIITNPRLPDNPVVFANDAFCRLSGYPREQIVGRNCRFLQGADTDPATVRAIRAAVDRVEALEIDIRNYRHDGEPFWNRLLMAPVYDADHNLAYFFASQVDVTIERERLTGLEKSNAALMAELTGRLRLQQERERELDFALKAGRFGTWSLELAGLNLTSSDQCKALFGVSPETPFSYDDRIAAILDEDRDATVAAFEQTVANGGDYEVEYRINQPNGDIRWLATRGQSFCDADGKPLRLAGVSLDITAVKRAQRRRLALADLTDRLRDLDATADISYVAAEAIGRTLEVDRAGYGLVDTRTETITIERDWNAPGVTTLAGLLNFRDYGSYIDDLKRGDAAIVEDCRLDPRTAATAASLEAINARSFINMPLTEQGDLVALLYLNHGRARAWPEEDLEFVRDVAERTRVATERRRAEKELADLAASLEQQVTDRTAQLMTAEDALRQSQKMEAVGQLTGGLAHDFNNLLTVIRGSVELLRRPDVSPERRERYIGAIADTADRATRLTSQLLAFSRRQTLKPETFDAGDAVGSVQQMIHTLVGSRIFVQVDLPSRPCTIHADRSQFETALVNMAANARDAMNGEGRLTFTVGTAGETPAVRSHPATQGEFVTVAVADTGTGIAPDALDKIFEPFFTTKEVGQGTGLGLSQVFGFAKQSGGDVLVDNRDAGGVEFTLYLPAAAEVGDDTVAATADAGHTIGEGACILVVEDNAQVGNFAIQALSELGYNAVLAGDGHTALDKLDADDAGFDVVFSDVVMPGMSGVELGQEIRRRHPNLPVILASGYSSVLAEGGTHGFELLQKPYSIEELSRALRKLSDRATG